MNREIKFKGKDLKTGEWAYGSLIIDVNTKKCYICRELPDRYSENGGWVEVDPETVGQYIEKQDVDKKEIYEGDIVEIEGFKEPMEVFFKDGYFGWGRQHYGMYSFDPFSIEKIRVVGNIHDNPELLAEMKRKRGKR